MHWARRERSRLGEGFDFHGPEVYSRLPEPTRTYPGSPAKVEEMAARFERLEHLHHPDDQVNDDDHAWEIEVPRNGRVAKNGRVEDLVKLLVRDEKGEYAPVPDQPERIPRLKRSRTQKEKDRQVANREQETWRKRLERARKLSTADYDRVVNQYHEWLSQRPETPVRIIRQVPPTKENHTSMAKLLEAAQNRFNQLLAPLQTQMAEIQAQMRAMEIAREVVQSILTDGPEPSANGNGHAPKPVAGKKTGRKPGSKNKPKRTVATAAGGHEQTREESAPPSGPVQVGKDTVAGRMVSVLRERGPLRVAILADLMGEEDNIPSLHSAIHARDDVFVRDHEAKTVMLRDRVIELV